MVIFIKSKYKLGREAKKVKWNRHSNITKTRKRENIVILILTTSIYCKLTYVPRIEKTL